MLEFTNDANILNLEALGNAIAGVAKVMVESIITATNAGKAITSSLPVESTRLFCITSKKMRESSYELNSCYSS